MNLLPNVTESITNFLLFIGNKFEEKTKQPKSINKINDNRLKFKKGKEIMDKLGLNFTEYSIEMNLLITKFSETVNIGIGSYKN